MARANEGTHPAASLSPYCLTYQQWCHIQFCASSKPCYHIPGEPPVLLSPAPVRFYCGLMNHASPFLAFQYKDERERREKDLLHSELDFDKCGLAAAQTMAGEDPGKLARTAQQHAQVSFHLSSFRGRHCMPSFRAVPVLALL